MGLRFENKVVIITGGSRGIGAGCVKTFVSEGGKVVIADVRDEAGAALQDELNACGPGEVHYLHCDVTKESDIESLMSTTVQKFGRLDCLINNAGWHPPPQVIDDISLDEFRQLFNLNVLGYFLTCKHSLPHLRKSKGSIINNSSLVAQIGQQKALPYVATKGAVTAMTKALAVDEAPHGVRVNSFSPSLVWTELTEEYLQKAGYKDIDLIMKEMGRNQVMGRAGTVEECGKLCLFLAVDATFMTGVDLPITGGAELDYGRKCHTQP
ncbi:hypothetical protein CAPTEDRAFT_135145 [Capitella teleta]|uniref:17-beta-hydroxysteroid dehydrogenase 14 n=1 Tax=Capitella teleta TaxID=283909 RepID=R7TP54_CAPTE|nr:hypothetical protein CAPTEDRAFT_135145 [Capitella teleta]|eukprot:ELT95332.1 hypothetical protein CAPTEDRAFT_135145 [Capitella teleta]